MDKIKFSPRITLILRGFKRWCLFLLWLPWFILTLPWQLRKAYQQTLSAINIQDNLKLDDFESVQYQRPELTPKNENRPLKDDNGRLMAK